MGITARVLRISKDAGEVSVLIDGCAMVGFNQGDDGNGTVIVFDDFQAFEKSTEGIKTDMLGSFRAKGRTHVLDYDRYHEEDYEDIVNGKHYTIPLDEGNYMFLNEHGRHVSYIVRFD